ncbi:MAG: phospho-sugar mutase [Oscillospiraceae bacterium]|nr:phospho-sugar mutase [Oscillospiraceae bacterium]
MSYNDEYRRWLETPVLTEEERNELLQLEGNEKELESRFYAPLGFGTAGLRGVMAMGLNRMNIYVIRQTTQALAKLIKANGGEERGAAIAYDCRINSERFAREAACVLAANGIKVFLFDGLRPTPELSFAIKRYGCIAGINVTASHNPKEYNGYKAYWEDGAQLPPEHARIVEAEIRDTDIFTGARLTGFDRAVSGGLITMLGGETDEEFLACALGQSIDRGTVGRIADEFKVVYTPFHGAGYRLVPEILRRIGVKNIIPVAEQMIPDGNFPTVANPNPEYAVGYTLALEYAKRHGGDIIIGTDPDSDRVGLMFRERDGEYTLLSGNQTGALLLEYIASARKRMGAIPEKSYAIRTIVSSDMIDAICENYGLEVEETFTGFKFIAERIGELEPEGRHYIFSYEESFGYLVGDYCRDKDAVTASMLICEMAASYAEKGKNLRDAMNEMYEKYGAYTDETISVMMPGINGSKRMDDLMESFRNGGFKFPGGFKIRSMTDFETGEVISDGGVTRKLRLKGSNVLSFEFDGDRKLMVRPSGTEPKIKFYIFAKGKDMEEAARRKETMTGLVKRIEKEQREG